ncbi:unnamed protein product [Lepeophtheirus salmonis]|uniref:(salmon louse) hypothetical protein n=1 Tax=Lepeophtheirus salmonis TaxID=72036 RepID=A0A7R8CKA8_LEPSM|nr:unnamed protein product [Lepeophtheirus salmonis]CAF2813598.1 unnamed protein product [Lepeophtheirus salmonis]
MLRKKEEVQKLEEMNRLQAHMEKEEARLKKERRQEDIRKQEEFERQRKYEEQLKQKHMEQERQKDQQLLYEKKIQKDKEERDRLHTLQMGQRQERIRKQQEKDENEKKIEQLRLEEERRCQEEMRQIEEETERQRRRSKKQNGHQLLDINKMEEQNITYRQSHHNQSTESRRHRSRHRSREGGCFNPQDQKEVHRPVTPIDVKTGHVNSKAHFFNERSKSMDRNDEYEPRRHRGHIVKDWIRTPQSEEHDPPSRPGSSLGQTLGAVKHTIDNWNHSALHQKTGVEPPVSRARSLSQHRDWKPCVRDRPVTPTCFDTVDTHKVQDTIKDWGANRQGSGRNSPIPSRMIAETFADRKETFYMEEDAPWRSKSTPEPNLKLINISVTRNVVKEKPKPKVEMIPPPLPKEHVEKCNRVQSRNLFITELPDLPLHQESTSTKYESKVMTSTTSSSQVHFEEKTPCDILGKDKNIPVPVVSESWLTGIQNSKPMSTSHNVLSTTSSASTIAHLEGLKSPTQTGKTPLPVLAGWYDTDSKKLPHSPKDQGIHHEVPRAPPPPLPSKETNPRLLNQQKCSPTIQKYENEVDKRQRELEELRNLRSARNKRLQDAFELGDPYLEYEESVESYSDDYTDDGIVEEGIPNEPSRPAPTRRIANLFNRSSDEWKEEQAHCPPLRNSSQEFMKGVNS